MKVMIRTMKYTWMGHKGIEHIKRIKSRNIRDKTLKYETT
jgi:hypothetical protein